MEFEYICITLELLLQFPSPNIDFVAVASITPQIKTDVQREWTLNHSSSLYLLFMPCANMDIK